MNYTVKKDYYTYIHLHPETNQVFYVGKEIGERATDFKRRSKEWKHYNNQFENYPKVLIVKDGLTTEEASNLEQKLINKLESFLTGGTLVNTDGIGFNPNVSVRISFDNEMPEYSKDSKYKGWTDEAIIKNLLSFPNEETGEMLYKRYEELLDYYNQYYDDIEEYNDSLIFELDIVFDQYEALLIDLTSSAINFTEFQDEIKLVLHDLNRFIVKDENDINPEAAKVTKKFELELRRHL